MMTEQTRTTPDGMSWVDPQGQAPKLDAQGRLAEPFVLILSTGVHERWPVGMRLPNSPGQWHAIQTALRVAKARTRDEFLTQAAQSTIIEQTLGGLPLDSPQGLTFPTDERRVNGREATGPGNLTQETDMSKYDTLTIAELEAQIAAAKDAGKTPSGSLVKALSAKRRAAKVIEEARAGDGREPLMTDEERVQRRVERDERAAAEQAQAAAETGDVDPSDAPDAPEPTPTATPATDDTEGAAPQGEAPVPDGNARRQRAAQARSDRSRATASALRDKVLAELRKSAQTDAQLRTTLGKKHQEINRITRGLADAGTITRVKDETTKQIVNKLAA